MPTNTFSDDQYRASFHEGKGLSGKSIKEAALERALDIRKFEIDLYWKRATYFWAFIAASMTGFIAIQASNTANKDDLSVLLCNLGMLFSFAWLCVNRGSKYWQENWEYHVDMLEDAVHGPLYKVVLSRSEPRGWRHVLVHLITGPSPISVSKVNQIVSLFVLLVWIGLLVYSLPPFDHRREVDWYYVGIIGLNLLSWGAILKIGRTYSGGYWHRGTIRTASINNDCRPDGAQLRYPEGVATLDSEK